MKPKAQDVPTRAYRWPYLTPEQYAAIESAAAREHRTMAAQIRTIIDVYFAALEDKAAA